MIHGDFCLNTSYLVSVCPVLFDGSRASVSQSKLARDTRDSLPSLDVMVVGPLLGGIKSLSSQAGCQLSCASSCLVTPLRDYFSFHQISDQHRWYFISIKFVITRYKQIQKQQTFVTPHVKFISAKFKESNHISEVE